nr:MAG TPA: hypothetical protein [Caudoviricetes sp.]
MDISEDQTGTFLYDRKTAGDNFLCRFFDH